MEEFGSNEVIHSGNSGGEGDHTRISQSSRCSKFNIKGSEQKYDVIYPREIK